MECLLFLELREQMAHFDVHYGQDKKNSWEPPISWGLRPPEPRQQAN